jgi:hypothetical protein
MIDHVATHHSKSETETKPSLNVIQNISSSIRGVVSRTSKRLTQFAANEKKTTTCASSTSLVSTWTLDVESFEQVSGHEVGTGGMKCAPVRISAPVLLRLSACVRASRGRAREEGLAGQSGVIQASASHRLIGKSGVVFVINRCVRARHRSRKGVVLGGDMLVGRPGARHCE